MTEWTSAPSLGLLQRLLLILTILPQMWSALSSSDLHFPRMNFSCYLPSLIVLSSLLQSLFLSNPYNFRIKGCAIMLRISKFAVEVNEKCASLTVITSHSISFPNLFVQKICCCCFFFLISKTSQIITWASFLEWTFYFRQPFVKHFGKAINKLWSLSFKALFFLHNWNNH